MSENSLKSASQIGLDPKDIAWVKTETNENQNSTPSDNEDIDDLCFNYDRRFYESPSNSKKSNMIWVTPDQLAFEFENILTAYDSYTVSDAEGVIQFYIQHSQQFDVGKRMVQKLLQVIRKVWVSLLYCSFIDQSWG